MAIQGLRTTQNFVTDERPKSWREGILRLYPNGKAPLTGLTSMMKTRSVTDPEYHWWEKSLPTQRLALSASIVAGTTTFTVSSGALALKAGHLLRSEENGEIVRVVTDPNSDTSIQVARGFAGSTAAAITFNGAGVNPNFFVMGTIHSEGSNAPTGVNYDPTKRTNYTQIFRNTFEATNTALQTTLRTVDAAKEMKRECLELHSIEMEKAFFFGKSVETTIDGKPARTSDGIYEYVNSNESGNINTPGATTTLSDLETIMYNAFKYGSSEKLGFCGNRFLLRVQQICRINSFFTVMNGVKEFGMSVSRLTTPFGELVLKSHPLFNQLTGGTTGGSAYYSYEDWCFILDMANIQYVHLNGRDTKYEPELQENGVDGLKSGYRTECGLEIHHPLTHYIVKAVKAAAIDS